MPFSPHNTNVYLQAVGGALAGIRSSGNFLLDAKAADYLAAAQAADAFAQSVDTQWQNIVNAAPNQFELSALLSISYGVWNARSQFSSDLSNNPGNYTAVAQGVVALAIEGNAQIVNEGVDPTTNIYAGGGGPGMAITQLTGAVTAGPGPGSVVATIVLGAGATVTGVLPAGNQANQTMAGDVTGTTGASVVAKINGTSVPAGGALTIGNVLTVTGASSTAYQAPGGGLTAPVTGTWVSKTANYTLDSGGSDFGVFADTSGGAFNLTFPAPTNGRGFYFIDKKGTFGTNNLTLVPHGAEKINLLAANKALQANFGHYWAWSDGTDWYVS